MIINFKKGKSAISPMFLLNYLKIIAPCMLFFIVAFFLFLDKPSAYFFHSHFSFLQDPLILITKLGNPVFSLLIFPALFFFSRFILKMDKASRKFWFISLSLPISILCSETLEIVFGKSNPYWLFLHGEVVFRFFQWNPAFHSFPSSISTTIGAVGTSLACLYPKSCSLFPFLAFVLGLSPAFLTICFLSDALCGVWIGMTLAAFTFKIMKKEISF